MRDYLYAGKKGLYCIQLDEEGGRVRAEATGPIGDESRGAEGCGKGPVARVVEPTEQEADRAMAEQLERMGA
jgi:hypothetical protein